MPRHLAALVVGLLAFSPLATVRALDMFRYDLRLVRKLTEMGLKEYATLQLQLIEKRYPDKKDAINIQKAYAFYSIGEIKEADIAVESIGPKSEFYTEALLLKGQVYAKSSSRHKEADAVFKQFFKRVKRPKPSDDKGVEDWNRAVNMYSFVLKELKRPTQAQKVLDSLIAAAGDTMGERSLIFRKAEILLDAEEQKGEEGKAINTTAVQGTLKAFKQLGYTLDGPGVSSNVQIARANVILGYSALKSAKKTPEFKKAIGYFKMAIEAIKASEKLMVTFEKEALGGDKSKSPMAGGIYYTANAYFGIAQVMQKAKKVVNAEKLTANAAKLFEVVTVDYESESYKMKALTRHAAVKDFMKKNFGKELAMSRAQEEGQIDVKLEQAKAFFEAKNFAKAAPIYLDAVRVGRRSRRLPEIVERLVICYCRMGQFLEAEALCSYLFTALPEEIGTQNCLYRLGGLVNLAARDAKKKKKLKEYDRLKEKEMGVWEYFVEVAPNHPKAAGMAYLVAEREYGKASRIAKRAKSEKNQKKKKALLDQVLVLYRASASKYQRVIDRYSSSEKGVRAFYKRGWCNYSLGNQKEAIGDFLAYAQAETLKQYAEDRAEAKFRAGELLMGGDAPQEAIQHFSELLVMLKPGNKEGINPKTRTAKRIREGSGSLLAWSYDRAGELVRPRLTEQLARIREIDKSIDAAGGAIAGKEMELETLDRELAELDRHFKELEQFFTVIRLDYMKAALEDAKKRAEETAGKSEEEKQRVLQNQQLDAKRLAEQREQQFKTELDGDRSTRTADRGQIQKDQAEQEIDVDRIAGELAKANQHLAELVQERKKKKDQAAGLREKRATAERNVVDLEAKKQTLATTLQDASDAYELAKSERQKRKELRKKRNEIEAQLEDCRNRLQKAHATRALLETPKNTRDLEKWDARLKVLEVEVAQAEVEKTEGEQQLLLCKLDGELLQAQLKAVAKALVFNAEMTKAVAKPLEGRLAMEKELLELGREALAGFRTAREKTTERIALLQSTTRNTIAKKREKIEQAGKARLVVEKEMAPIQAEFDGWKKKAVDAFVRFMKEHPKYNEMAKNMARLGTIHLEMKDYKNTAKILQTLAEKYPKSDTARQALFKLGRAQVEIKQLDAAKSTFEQLLKSPSSITPGDLQFLSNRMLELHFPAISLAASRELIKRSADKNDPDHEMIREKVREPMLFKAAQASFQLKKYKEAVEFAEMVLSENAKSAYFFEIQFLCGMARRRMQPPDLAGAREDFLLVNRYAGNNALLRDRSSCRVAELDILSDDVVKVRKGLALLLGIVEFSNPENDESRPWLELAMAESAKAYALLGDQEESKKLVTRYKKIFPKGQYLKSLQSLPAAKFRPDPKPSVVEEN